MKTRKKIFMKVGVMLTFTLIICSFFVIKSYAAVNPDSEDYQAGYQAGYDMGHYVGYDEGYGTGKREGHEEGYALGNQDGYDEGYNKGLSDGLNETTTSENYKSTFKSIFESVFQAPIDFVKGAFNFEVFGLNIFKLASFALTIVLVVWVVKRVKGWLNDIDRIIRYKNIKFVLYNWYFKSSNF